MNTIGTMQEVKPEELNKKDWLILGWGFAWRGIIITICSMIIGSIVGFILGSLMGIVMAILNIPQNVWMQPLKFISFIIGFGIGFLFIIVYIKWLLKANFHSFRLALIKRS